MTNVSINKTVSNAVAPKNIIKMTLRGLAVWSGFEVMNMVDSFMPIPPIAEVMIGTGVSYGIHEDMGLGITTHGLAEASARFKAGQPITNVIAGDWLNSLGQK